MAEEKMVAVINQGSAPHVTSRGLLLPKQSIELVESEALKMCKYMHIVLASSVVAAAGIGEKLKAENDVLRAKIAEMEKELGAKVADLTSRLKAFLEADKKDLPALQKEHAAAVVAVPVQDCT